MKPASSSQFIWRIPLLYVTIGVLWILFADRLVSALVEREDLRLRILAAEPWLFLLFTTLLLLVVLRREWRFRMQGAARLRETSETLQAFVQASPLALIVLDRDARVRLWNPAAERIFGWSETDVQGQPAPYVLPEERQAFNMSHASILAGQIESGTDALHQRKDGSRINTSVYTAPLRNAAGEIESTIALVADISEHKAAERRLQHQLDRLAALRRIDIAISASLDLSMTLEIFLDQLLALLGVDAAAVLLLNPHNQSLEYRCARGFDEKQPHQIVRFGEKNAGWVARERTRLVIESLSKQLLELSIEPTPLQVFALSQGYSCYVGVPLMAKGQVRGVLEVYCKHHGEFDAEWLEFLDTLARQAAIAIDNAVLFDDVQRANAELVGSYDATLEGWALALELRDRETQGHTRRVTEMTINLARAMAVGDAELAHIRRGALLHDIGKLGVPDSILLKEGPLTDEEWKIMRRHPVHAYEMLSRIAYLRPALDIPYCHHERWDGSGYPRGLKEDQIPLAARIFAVADVYDALIQSRPYSPAWPEEQATHYIVEQAGKQLDPTVVNIFERLLLLDQL